MIAIATDDARVAVVCSRLAELGLGPIEVMAPGATRRIVLAAVANPREAEGIAVGLRSEGEMAVVRPDEGAARRAWDRDSRPTTIADRVTICPAWSEHDRDLLSGLIELGAGGFGNGHHPTTRLMVELLAARVTGDEHVLDVGCGSGVLALAALTLGAGRAVAVDIKAEAVVAARHNAAINGVSDRLMATDAPLAEVDGRFDVVVANIARAGVVSLAPQLLARVSPGGWLVVSGITPSQCSQVAGFLRPLVEIERRSADGWSALVLADDR